MTVRTSSKKTPWSDVASAVLFVVGLLSLAAAVIGFSIWGKGRPLEMGIAAIAALVVMLLSKIDRIHLLEAGSFKLQMREAQRVIQEAQVSIESVRALAAGLSAMSLEMVSIQGRWGSMPMPKRLEMKESIDAILDDLGVEREGELWQASERFIARLEFDHLQKIRGAATKNVEGRPGLQSSEHKALMAAFDSLLQYRKVKKTDASTIREVLTAHRITSPEVLALVDDFEHFRKTRKFRRPDLWLPVQGDEDSSDAS